MQIFCGVDITHPQNSYVISPIELLGFIFRSHFLKDIANCFVIDFLKDPSPTSIMDTFLQYAKLVFENIAFY